MSPYIYIYILYLEYLHYHVFAVLFPNKLNFYFILWRYGMFCTRLYISRLLFVYSSLTNIGFKLTELFPEKIFQKVYVLSASLLCLFRSWAMTSYCKQPSWIIWYSTEFWNEKIDNFSTQVPISISFRRKVILSALTTSKQVVSFSRRLL